MAELTLSDGTRSHEFIASSTIYLAKDGLSLPVVSRADTFAEGSDSEGRTRVRTRPTNPEGSFTVYIKATTNALFWDAVDELQELVESAHREKGTLTYTPPNGTQVTYDLEAISVTGLPQSGVMLNLRHAEATVTFESKPYGRLASRRVNVSDSYETKALALSPAIYLPLDSTYGLTDRSGNARNGTAAGGLTAGGYTPGPLTVGDTGATDFDGTDDRITTTYSPFVNGRATTFTGWYSRDTNNTGDALIGANATGVVLRFSGAGVLLFSANNTNQVSWVESATGSWKHWAVVFDEPNDTVAFYLNGSLVSSQAYTYQWSGSYSQMHIGAENGAASYFDGKMRGVAVYERALTAAEILDLYDAGKAQVTLAGPIDYLEALDVPGQVSALGELTLTDISTQARNHVEVAVQNQFVPASAEPIQLNAVTQITPLAGASNTRAGSIATNVIRAGIVTTPVAVCVASGQPHYGKWKVRARLWPSATGTKVRLAWRAGSAPFVREKWVTVPGEDAWYDVDLGTVNIPRLTPTHTADFRVEAFAATGLPTLDVDVLYFEPADGYTRLRGDLSQDVATAAVVAADDFDAQTAGNLAGKTPLISTGNWSGAGDADDFEAVGTSTAKREKYSDAATGTQTGRFELCGSGVTAAVTVSADVQVPVYDSDSVSRNVGVVLRYVDTNNYLLAYMTQTKSESDSTLTLVKRVASSATVLGTATWSGSTGVWYTITAAADATGNVTVRLGPTDSEQPTLISVAADANLATAGAIDDGMVGLWDWHTSATVTGARLFDNFAAVSNAAGATIANPAINSGRAVILQHNTALTGNSGGTGQGLTPIREGKYLKIQPETRNGTRSRIAVKARRVDVDEGTADSGTADQLRATLTVTPRVHLLGP